MAHRPPQGQPPGEIYIRKAIMKSLLRMLSDRPTAVLTVPSLKFGSLQERNLTRLETLFRQTVPRITGGTLILDVVVVRSAGAAFLTEVNRLAEALRKKQVKIVIAGDLGGLFKLVGWHRRFRCYPSLLEAFVARADWSLPAESVDASSSQSSRYQVRPRSPPGECQCCWNENEHLA
jgi:hypothetical protein